MKENGYLWLLAAGITLVAFRRQIREGLAEIEAAMTQDSIANRAKYAPYIAAAEKHHGIPSGMLLRLITVESHFRTDVITGARVSSAGALGIAQFMPATARDLGVNPLDPVAAIDAAGRYLKMCYGWVGKDWTKAVAAYNWGAGAVNRAVKNYGADWLAHVPDETRNYVANIA